MNARKNVPNGDGADTRCPNPARVWPERSTSQSSMQSAPSAIAETSVMSLRPWVRRSGSVAEIHNPVNQSLDPEPVSERRRKQHTGVRDRPLVIEDAPASRPADRSPCG